MVADLKTLIIRQIKEVFGDVKVYDEPVQQGLKTPAFLVLIFHDDLERQLRHQMKRDISINVTYFPKDKRSFNMECDLVDEHFKLEFRHIANKFHVHKLEAVKQDGVLNISFKVKAIQQEVFEETKMESLKFGGVGFD